MGNVTENLTLKMAAVKITLTGDQLIMLVHYTKRFAVMLTGMSLELHHQNMMVLAELHNKISAKPTHDIKPFSIAIKKKVSVTISYCEARILAHNLLFDTIQSAELQQVLAILDKYFIDNYNFSITNSQAM